MNQSILMQRLGDSDEFTPMQLSEIFGCHVNTIYSHIRSGKLEAYKLFGYRVQKAAVIRWFEKITDF